MVEFLAPVIQGFSQGAPDHHHLVFKAHPLEDGRIPLRRDIMRLASQNGIADRIHFISGGKLAPLLDQAKTAITVNSTAGQQVLWRGLPLKTLGDAVYTKPELTANPSIPDFYQHPIAPDREAYLLYRQFLLETSQVTGGFYSARGRRQLLRNVIDKMISGTDPYDINMKPADAMPQQLRVIG